MPAIVDNGQGFLLNVILTVSALPRPGPNELSISSAGTADVPALILHAEQRSRLR
jgi:hypothetical protein